MAKLFFTTDDFNQDNSLNKFMPVDGGGFRAAAICLMDQSMSPVINDSSWMRAILTQYALFFPERMPRWTINQSRDLELQQLTYTLSRIALDEILAHPYDYHAAFAHKPNEEIQDWAVNIMAAPPKHAVVALANAISMPIEIYLTDAGREVYIRECYIKNKTHKKLTKPLCMRCCNDKFSPLVDQAGVWRGIEQLEYLPINTCPLNLPLSLKTIDEMLASEACSRWTLYQNNLREMQSISLNERDWRLIYQQNWQSISQVDMLGCEHGIQDYFAKLSEKYGELADAKSPWMTGVAGAVTLGAFSLQDLRLNIERNRSF